MKLTIAFTILALLLAPAAQAGQLFPPANRADGACVVGSVLIWDDETGEVKCGPPASIAPGQWCGLAVVREVTTKNNDGGLCPSTYSAAGSELYNHHYLRRFPCEGQTLTLRCHYSYYQESMIVDTVQCPP